MSTLDEIAKLKALLDDGAITQDEYDAEKARLFAASAATGPAGTADAAGSETGGPETFGASEPAGAAGGAGPAPGPQQSDGQQGPWGGQQQWGGPRPGQPNYGPPYGAGHIPGTPYHSYQEDVAANKVFGILAYLWVLCFVSAFAAPKESHYARFHANQGLVLFIFEIAGWIVFGALGAISGVSVFSTWGLALGPLAAVGILSTLYSLGMLALAIIGVVNAARGEQKPLPVIGGIIILK
jgi:uncharacterized membrane protein